jgi:tetratricopeptide (TPR) repeat protein
MIPFHWLAALYSQRAEATARIVNQPLQAEARVLIVTNLYNIGTGHWQKIEDGLQQSVEICNRFGDWHQLGNSLAILAKAAYHQGQFDRGIERWEELYRVAKRNEDILHQAWGLNGQAEGQLRLGQVDRAVNLLESAIALFAQNQDRVSETAAYGVLAQARWYQGEVHLARQAAEIAAQKLAQFSAPSSHYLVEGYAGVAQVYLALWETASDIGGNADATELKKLARLSHQAVKGCQQFARIFPVGTPRSFLVQGWLYWLSGRTNRAHQAWEKSLTAAVKLGMPYEQGLANYEIGRHSAGEVGESHRNRARTIFESLGAAVPDGALN